MSRKYNTKEDYIRLIFKHVDVSPLHRDYLENALERLEEGLEMLPNQRVVYAVNKQFLKEERNRLASEKAGNKARAPMSAEHRRKIGLANKRRWDERRAAAKAKK